jgi:hypothetical protein
MAGTFELFQDKAGKYRFRLKAAHGQVLAASQPTSRRRAPSTASSRSRTRPWMPRRSRSATTRSEIRSYPESFASRSATFSAVDSASDFSIGAFGDTCTTPTRVMTAPLRAYTE